ncbi:MAG: hypothetical protein COS90_12005 [Deltaproteobacteria bacterium CG07_land_8_20_14_0_80_60_11]|nr:MAG: hypothetical protein COS90_12005 [Deltaproteobacteria bacterium CG07_land_8_20_14_0_80_60_11]
MKSSKKPLDKIEAALIAAYRKQEELQFPPDWRQQVMQDISSMAGPTAFPQEKKVRTMIPRRIGALAAVAVAAVVGWLILANLDRYDPWITLKPDLADLESHAAFWLEAGDVDSGLRHVKVTVIQKEMKIEVLSRNLEPPGGIWHTTGDAVKKVDFPLALDAQALGLQEGQATLVITARDLSWRNWFRGRSTTMKKEMVIYYKKSP